MRTSACLWLFVALAACTSKSSSPCSNVGTYIETATVKNPDCCPGLQHVAVGYAGYGSAAETTRVCWPNSGDVGIFGCVAGSCGDGQCEGAEALPCGCALDCPTAAWGPSSDAGVQAAHASDAGCSPLGDYPHSAFFGTPACCPGLNRLEIRIPYSTDDDTVRACVQDDPQSFSCITGGCGDGQCEAPEALPCVCPVDCPSAVWELTSDAGRP